MAAVTVVIVDTNIIAACPRLDNNTWTSLVEHAEEWGIRIVVPEVVVMETVSVVRRRWRSERDKLAALPLEQFRLTDNQAAMVTAIDQESDGYEDYLLARLGELGIKIQPVPPADHMEIARRASAGRAPFTRNSQGKSKDGYRDTLIWLTVLAVAHENTEDNVWLVSDNHTDFGPKPGNWTGPGTGEREDCPILFADDLAEELAIQGLSERVYYVVKAELLEQHLASQFAPIADSDLDDLVATLDMSTLAGRLMYLTIGLNLDPAVAALPNGVATGQIVRVQEQRNGWKFTEAARRGDAGWTARFAVDTQVGIDIAGAPWLDSQHTKILRMVGRIAVSSDGEIREIAVDSAEAPPHDPERVRRLNHGERGRVSGAFYGLDADVRRDIAASLAGSNMTEILKQQNADLMKNIAASLAGSNMTEILKQQNADLMKNIAAGLSSPSMTRI
jgi:rRNA-processing protein FCF1